MEIINSGITKIKQCYEYFIKNEKDRLIVSIIATFIIGLFAHAYCFSNLSLSHDCLNEFFLFGPLTYYDYSIYELKIATGRFLIPVYDMIFRGKITLPWFAGMMSLFWLSLSVFMTCKIFNIRNKLEIVLISAFYTTNISYIAEAGAFLHEIDVYAFGLLLSIISVYYWQKGKKYYPISALFLFMATAIYQAMLPVAIALIILLSMFRLLNKDDYKNVLVDGLWSIAIIGFTFVLYMLVVKDICSITKIPLHQGHNSLNHIIDKSGQSKLQLLIGMFTSFFEKLVIQPSIQSKTSIMINQIAILCVEFFVIVMMLIKSDVQKENKIMFVLLLIAMPFGMNLTYYGNNGAVHTLMCFSFWLTYLLILELVKWYYNEQSIKKINPKYQLLKYLLVFLFVVMVFGNIKTANAVYLKKAFEYENTYSLMTRIAERIETTEGYIPGETRVCIVGRLDFEKIEPFYDLYDLMGQQYVSTVSSENFWAAYYKYILNRPINLVGWKERDDIADRPSVMDMPVYPDEFSIGWTDGDILVVKLNKIYF